MRPSMSSRAFLMARQAARGASPRQPLQSGVQMQKRFRSGYTSSPVGTGAELAAQNAQSDPQFRKKQIEKSFLTDTPIRLRVREVDSRKFLDGKPPAEDADVQASSLSKVASKKDAAKSRSTSSKSKSSARVMWVRRRSSKLKDRFTDEQRRKAGEPRPVLSDEERRKEQGDGYHPKTFGNVDRQWLVTTANELEELQQICYRFALTNPASVLPPKPVYEGVSLDEDAFFKFRDRNSPEDWNLLLIATAKRGTLIQAMDCFRSLRENRMPTTIESYVAVCECAAANRQPDLVRDLIYDLGMQGINPPSEVYAELVRASLSVKDEIRAQQVLDTVEANEQKVGENLYVPLLEHYLELKKPEEAWKMFDKMRTSGITVTEASLVVMLNVCALENDAPRAVSLVDTYRFEGNELTVPLYNALIRACAYSDEMDRGFSKAYYYMRQMRADRLLPNTETFAALLDASANNQEFTMALQLVEVMEASNVPKDAAVYRSMLRNIQHTQRVQYIEVAGRKTSQNERILMAEKMVEEMKAENVEITAPVVETLFKCYTHANRVERAKVFLEGVQERFGLEPTQTMLLSAFRMALKTKKLKWALSILSDLKESGIPVTAVMYRRLLRLASRSGQYDTAVEIFEEMKSAGIAVERSDRALVLSCSKDPKEAAIHSHLLKEEESRKNYRHAAYHPGSRSLTKNRHILKQVLKKTTGLTKPREGLRPRRGQKKSL